MKPRFDDARSGLALGKVSLVAAATVALASPIALPAFSAEAGKPLEKISSASGPGAGHHRRARHHHHAAGGHPTPPHQVTPYSKPTGNHTTPPQQVTPYAPQKR